MNAGTDSAVELINGRGRGAVCLLCEHASAHIPAEFAELGVSAEHRHSHAVWDPGALALAQRLSARLDAPLVASRISRLVYDCNRPPEASSAIPDRSEQIEVPGNRDLSAEQRAARADLAYVPFCRAVRAQLERRAKRGTPTALVTVHSFSPVFFDRPRATEIGILHDSDSRLADAMLARAAELPGRAVQRNSPYGPADGVTHSLQVHGIAHGLPNVMLEVRNDLLCDEAGVEQLADELMDLLAPALAEVLGEAGHA